MDFTELYRQSNQLCRFSPSGNVIGTAVEHRLVLRDAESLQVTRLVNTPSTIHHIEFSPNGQFILCANYSNRKDSSGLKSHGWIRVYEVTETNDPDASHSVTETPWEGKVDEGLSGLVLATFATNSHILGFSESNLRISIYSMVDNTVRCIRQPKHSSFNGFSMRKDRRFMAYLERSDGRDNVVIIDMINWVIVKEFSVATTDAESISWSPCGRYILLVDTMFQYQLLVYSADGKMLGRCDNCTEEKIALGFRLAKWSPNAQFIAAGSYDGSIELLNNYNWTSLTDISVPSTYDPSEDDFVCIKESGPAKLNSYTSGYMVANEPTVFTKVNKEKSSTVGISIAEWNPAGDLLAVKNDVMPNVLMIYDVQAVAPLIVLNHLNPIKQVTWNPTKQDCLAFICSSSSCVYIWKRESTERILVPSPDFEVVRIQWSPTGNALIVSNKDKFCLAFPVTDQELQ